MVLTRSSYSRLGTPLTSPLTNPAKPRSSTKTTRTSKTPRNSLSSAAPSIAASEPPLTPNTLQFGFDLIDRLAHQQDPNTSHSNYLTPTSTSNPLGLQLSGQSSPPPTSTPLPPSMPPDSQASNPPVVEDPPLSSIQPQHDDPEPNDKKPMESEDSTDTSQPLDLLPPTQSQDKDSHQTTLDINEPLQTSCSSLTEELPPPPISNPSQSSCSSDSNKTIQPLQPPTESNPLSSSSSSNPSNGSNRPQENEVEDEDDELLNSLLKRAKEKARLIERKEVPVAEVGGSSHSDCGSSVTLQNIIRLDGEEKLKLALSRPLRPSVLTAQSTNSFRKPSNPSNNNSKQLPLNHPTPENFDRVASIRDRRLGHDTPSNKTPRSHFEWHDLPVQELTRETKMEIQAMRLHRTLDPKSFVKGGIEKSLKEPMPTKFLFGHIIDGSMNGGGQSTTKKRSFVDGLLQDDKSQEWVKKKYTHIQNVSGRNSGGKNFYKSVRENRLK